MGDSRKASASDPVGKLVASGEADAARVALTRKHAADLRKAAKLVESSAFELAALYPGDVIGELITMAANLQQLSKTIDKDTDKDRH